MCILPKCAVVYVKMYTAGKCQGQQHLCIFYLLYSTKVKPARVKIIIQVNVTISRMSCMRK